MTPEFIQRVRRDFDRDSKSQDIDWDAYLAGYLACLKRFGQQERREIKSELGYSRIGLRNV